MCNGRQPGQAVAVSQSWSPREIRGVGGCDMPYLIARIRAAGCSILTKWSSLARETMPIGEADLSGKALRGGQARRGKDYCDSRWILAFEAPSGLLSGGKVRDVGRRVHARGTPFWRLFICRHASRQALWDLDAPRDGGRLCTSPPVYTMSALCALTAPAAVGLARAQRGACSLSASAAPVRRGERVVAFGKKKRAVGNAFAELLEAKRTETEKEAQGDKCPCGTGEPRPPPPPRSAPVASPPRATPLAPLAPSPHLEHPRRRPAGGPSPPTVAWPGWPPQAQATTRAAGSSTRATRTPTAPLT